MRKYKVVRKPIRKYGKLWEAYWLAEKAVSVMIPLDQTVRALIAAGKFAQALAVTLKGQPVEVQLPITAVLASGKPWRWKGKWGKPTILHVPIEPHR